MKLVFICMLFAQSAFAGDEHFKAVQSVDDAFREAFVWEDKESAASLSDIGQYTLAFGAPALVFLSSESGERLTNMAGAVGAQVTVMGLTHVTKALSDRTRPNGKSDKSFFSGHTSAAFAGAGIICQQKKILCTPSLLMAASVGYFRIAADKHWFSDVLVGATIGVSAGIYLPSIYATW